VMADARIRPGGPDDFEQAIAVWRAAHEARRSGGTAMPSQEERGRRNIARDDSFLVVADDAGRIVGMALGMPALADDGAGAPVPGLSHIAMVFVAPDRWGQGLGGGLVDAILERARAGGYTRAQLWTHATNVRAQRLYEGRGFARSGREKADDGGEVIGLYAREL
jgi:GNAT superfamily N-acetyltransferase